MRALQPRLKRRTPVMRLPLNFTLLWQLLKTNENQKEKNEDS